MSSQTSFSKSFGFKLPALLFRMRIVIESILKNIWANPLNPEEKESRTLFCMGFTPRKDLKHFRRYYVKNYENFS
jgi:hypothetical protein